MTEQSLINKETQINWNLYIQNREALVRDHLNEWVVISKGKIQGFFPTEEDVGDFGWEGARQRFVFQITMTEPTIREIPYICDKCHELIPRGEVVMLRHGMMCRDCRRAEENVGLVIGLGFVIIVSAVLVVLIELFA